MPRFGAADLARRLGLQAEAVCRHYLSSGRRNGNYWLVGDVHNTPGRSMFVRLRDTAKGPAGKWTDAATGEHGDLLDVIRASLGCTDFADAAEEARQFLSLPRSDPRPAGLPGSSEPRGSAGAAQRLFALSQPLPGTLAATYLQARGITRLRGLGALRFHPRCYFRPEGNGPTETWPAMVAAVTDLGGVQTGAHRTWLARDGSGKAPILPPRKAMGDLLGHAVRFGPDTDVIAAGEGIETVLSVREALPGLSVQAALSANHLAALLFPAGLRRLYILKDRGAAGEMAAVTLRDRATAAGIEAVPITPARGDFNEDLIAFGRAALRARLTDQLIAADAERFLAPEG